MIDRILSAIFGTRTVGTSPQTTQQEAADFARWAQGAEEKRSSYMDQLIASRVPGGLPNTAAKAPVLEG